MGQTAKETTTTNNPLYSDSDYKGATIRQFQAGRTCPDCNTTNALRTLSKKGDKIECRCYVCGYEHIRIVK